MGEIACKMRREKVEMCEKSAAEAIAIFIAEFSSLEGSCSLRSLYNIRTFRLEPGSPDRALSLNRTIHDNSLASSEEH